MNLDEFERMTEESLEELPAPFKELLARNGIQVIVRAKVPEAAKEEFGDDAVFGIFFGASYGEFLDAPLEPARIELYKESFEREFDDPDEIRREVRTTVVHEVGHYFGFSEEELERLGYG